MIKIKKPKELRGQRLFNSHTLNELLPFLPERDCFFDTRHWVGDTIDGIVPFSITTRVVANSQQYLIEFATDKDESDVSNQED